MPSKPRMYVVGSGPSGVSAAQGLLASGFEVFLLDYGSTLEKNQADHLASLKNLSPEKWPQQTIDSLKGEMKSSVKGVQTKKVYGSEFAYRDNSFIDNPQKGVDLKSSLAFGGLSNVWGAALLPFIQQDIADWPITLKDLEPYFKAVLSFVGLAAQKDDLDQKFPLYSENPQKLNLPEFQPIFTHYTSTVSC